MKIKEKAIEFWESKRPEGWDLARHLKNCCVNCCTDAEKNLARAIADHYYQKGE